MACSHCPAPAVLQQRHSGTNLCREHFLDAFERRAKAELAKQGRLPAGTIAVALSGGKDSVAALHFVHGLAQGDPRLRVAAIAVDEGITGYRDVALGICRDVTARLGVPLHVISTRELAGYSIDEYAAGTHGPARERPPGTARPACSPCGVFRRAGIQALAKRIGAAAVVTGHNLDDMAQTILMNHLKGDVDRLARLAPHDGDGPFIPRRLPFRSTPEKEVLLYAMLHGLPVHQMHDGPAECPYAQRSQRFAMRDVLVQLEAKTPGTRHALLAGQERLKPLLAGVASSPLGTCTTCGEPSSGKTCMPCKWKA